MGGGFNPPLPLPYLYIKCRQIAEGKTVGEMAERFCDYCFSCKHDCKRKININECVNYARAIDLHEYNQMIKNQNTNIRRLCKENNLKYHIMLSMLKGKQVFKYKYREILERRLFEKEEYLPYIDKDVIDRWDCNF